MKKWKIDRSSLDGAYRIYRKVGWFKIEWFRYNKFDFEPRFKNYFDAKELADNLNSGVYRDAIKPKEISIDIESRYVNIDNKVELKYAICIRPRYTNVGTTTQYLKLSGRVILFHDHEYALKIKSMLDGMIVMDNAKWATMMIEIKTNLDKIILE